jgi:hypothetical protein
MKESRPWLNEFGGYKPSKRRGIERESERVNSVRKKEWNEFKESKKSEAFKRDLKNMIVFLGCKLQSIPREEVNGKKERQ